MAFDYLWQVSKWNDDNGDNPPEAWEHLDDDGRYGFDDELTYPSVVHAGANQLPATLLIDWEILEAPATGSLYFEYDLAAGGQGFVALGDAVGSGRLTITDHLRTAASFQFAVGSVASGTAFQGIVSGGSAALRQVERSSVNCEYEALPGARTLTSMRTELLRRTGYSAQVSSLTAGVSALYDSFLREAQEMIYTLFPAIETERFFRFPLMIGVRFYELRSNVDQDAVYLNPDYITSVHLVDNNETWTPLARGINPSTYTTMEQYGYPAVWDIGRCLEIFPAPQAEYFLYVKGKHGLGAFASDNDVTTIQPEPVFQYALGLAKNHKKLGTGGRNDGSPSTWTGCFNSARLLAMKAIARQHEGRRYIPNFGGGPVDDYVPNMPMLEEFID